MNNKQQIKKSEVFPNWEKPLKYEYQFSSFILWDQSVEKLIIEKGLEGWNLLHITPMKNEFCNSILQMVFQKEIK